MRAALFLNSLVIGCLCFLISTAAAQNYYPTDIGNRWVFESVDGIEQSVYSVEGPETIAGEERILLYIRTEEVSVGVADTDTYFLSLGTDAVNLHRTVFELKEPAALVTANFPDGMLFFPFELHAGDAWQIEGDATAALTDLGLEIVGSSITDFEVVGFEDVTTPAGTFENCAKVRLFVVFDGGFLNLEAESHQWFAPDIGPVQFENSNDILFKLISSNVLPVPYDVTGDRVVDILDLSFVAARFGSTDTDADVTGDGVVNILDLVRIAEHFIN